jgi:hypothetical protein
VLWCFRERDREICFLKIEWVPAAVLGFIGAKDGFFLFFLGREREFWQRKRWRWRGGREGVSETVKVAAMKGLFWTGNS